MQEHSWKLVLLVTKILIRVISSTKQAIKMKWWWQRWRRRRKRTKTKRRRRPSPCGRCSHCRRRWPPPSCRRRTARWSRQSGQRSRRRPKRRRRKLVRPVSWWSRNERPERWPRCRRWEPGCRWCDEPSWRAAGGWKRGLNLFKSDGMISWTLNVKVFQSNKE